MKKSIVKQILTGAYQLRFDLQRFATAQEVIKKFMAALANHGFAYSENVGTKMLDSAVRASTRYGGIQDVIDAMKSDQIAAEKQSIETVVKSVCGETYFNTNCVNHDGSVKTLSEIESTLSTAKKADGSDITRADVSTWIATYYSTLANVIREYKANIFLQEYCGIQLNNKFGFGGDGSTIYQFTNLTTGNTDTGAITGSDAGGTAAKTDRTVVPEEFNTYTANSAAAQKITTDARN